MASTTLLTLAQNIAKTQGLGYLSGSPSETGTTMTIIDTSSDTPFDADDSEELLNNAWVKIEADTAGTPLNVGEIRRLKAAGGYTPSTGTLTWNRAMSNATTTTMTYGVYMGVPPTRQGIERGLDEYINDVLRQLTYRHYQLLTLITDGDMEASGYSNWTASNATLSKVTTAANITTGTQALRVVNSSANGYARSALVSVRYGETYDIVADLTNVTGEAKLQFYDETNGAEIDSATTSEIRKGYLYLDNGYIPSGCRQVSVRLINTSASGDSYWSKVTLRKHDATEMALPSWFVNPAWIEEVVYRVGSTKEQTDDSYDADMRNDYVLHYHKIIDDHTGATPYRVRFSQPPRHGHLYARCHRPYAELSADTDSTTADKDWVKAWALSEIFKDKSDKDAAAYWRDIALSLHRIHSPQWQGRSFVPHKDI